jgi:cytochrome P450
MTTEPLTTGAVARVDQEAEQLFYRIMTQPLDDPYPSYHELRSMAPALVTSDGTLVLSRYADCDASLRSRSLGKGDEWLKLQLSHVDDDKLRDVMRLMQRSMILTNPPDHTRLRRLVSSAFTSRHVDGLRESTTRRVDAMLDELAERPGEDFMSAFAIPLPVNVIADLLGIPESARESLIPTIHELGLLMEPASGPAEINIGAAAAMTLASYFSVLLAEKRARPADDLLSRLATAPSDEASPLDETEMIATALLLFGAGNTPTANLLGTALHALRTHPEQLERLRTDRSLIPSAVEEVLRYDSPSQFDVQTVLEPVTLAGADLEPGRIVMTLLGGANHDPDRFDDPDALDVGRQDNRHLSFAAGIHLCLGAHLSRMEAAVVLDRLLDRFPDFSFTEEPRRRPGLGNRGFEWMPIALRP